jgi:transcriptional regulator of acetoin/glycerol metabolism
MFILRCSTVEVYEGREKMKELLQELTSDFDSILDLFHSFNDIFFLKDGEGRYIHVDGKSPKLLNIGKNVFIRKKNIELGGMSPPLREF